MAPGLWLIRRAANSSSSSRVHHLCEIPSRPYDFTSIMIVREELAIFLHTFLEEYYTEHRMGPSHQQEADAILTFLSKKAGIRMVDKIPDEIERRLDLDL